MTTQTKTTWRKVKIKELVSSISEPFSFKGRDEIVFLNTSDIENGHVLNHQKISSSKNLPGIIFSARPMLSASTLTSKVSSKLKASK